MSKNVRVVGEPLAAIGIERSPLHTSELSFDLGHDEVKVRGSSYGIGVWTLQTSSMH